MKRRSRQLVRRIAPEQLAGLNAAETRLARVERVDEVKAIRDKAEAFRVYVKSARAGLPLQNRAAAIKILAEHRAGVLLARIERSKGGRGKTVSILDRVCADNEIGNVTRHRWQTLATLPVGDIRKREAACNADGVELTSSGIYVDLCRQRRATSHATAVDAGSLTGRYRVVYADPPWQYDDSDVITETDAYERAARHYPTMPVDAIAALPVADHVADEAVLFLWITSPLLPVAFPVIDAWGFTYKTSMIWDKVSHNFGHYLSVRHEVLLIATRGSCMPDRLTPMIDSVQVIPKSREHSAKPEAFREFIVRLYDGPYLELFGRATVDRWTVWGNQVEVEASA